ncbi:MAG TPA: DEAD/DEAH box helicase, partial [Candidatus Krumholzibacterium sp.]|nr:DEAD/DEAH box helicase [Candidatus Krumholzibacterium sp.]
MGKGSGKDRYVDIALPVPLDRTFTYRIPEGTSMPGTGARVVVPFGRRKMTGYVIRVSGPPPEDLAVREIARIIDEPPLITPGLMRLAERMAEYYVQPLGIVLRAVLPPAVKGSGRKPGTGELAGRFPGEPERPELSEEQAAAFAAVKEAIDTRSSGAFLLHGVTGSGKTEVYLRCIEEALSGGRSAIVLVPEIALIPQSTARFQRRFGEQVAVLHSRLTGPQRSTIWKRASTGDVKVVIGPRSAVFVPLGGIGVIVVDEEQDTSFKQDERPHYSAVTVARWR